MTTLAADSKRDYLNNGLEPMLGDIRVVASDIIYEGAAVGDNGSGYARPLTSGDPFRGFAARRADNSSGSAGDIECRVRRQGEVELSVTGASAVTDRGKPVYATDDDTFTLTSGGTMIGRVSRWVTGTTCYVVFQAADVSVGEPVQTKSLHIPVLSAVEADGTALADFADGASNTPGYELAGGEGIGIRWNNAAAPDPIMYEVLIPSDLDSNEDLTVNVLASKTGATVGDAVTWAVGAFFISDGALYDADADAGGTSSAMTGDASAKTAQLETLTIASADVPSGPAVLALTIQPTDGTLGTDDVILHGLWIGYTPKSANG